MREKVTSIRELEETYDKFLVAEYLKYGSVDETIRANRYDLAISYPGYHHLLDRWGIVKAAGPNTSLTEAISFFVRLVEEKIPLEALYRKMPASFTPSMATLHRIYQNIKEEVKKKITERSMRRAGAALVLTPSWDGEQVLVAVDVSPPRLDLGKPFAALSLPMGFARRGEKLKSSVLRVIQQEVFTNETIEQSLPEINYPASPFMFVDIADVRVAVYHIGLSRQVSAESSFSSFKLKNHRFVSTRELVEDSRVSKKYRTGVFEIAAGYLAFRRTAARTNDLPFFVSSSLNLALKSFYFESLRGV